jgi:hypothetical protein
MEPKLILDRQNTPVDGVWQLGYVKPFEFSHPDRYIGEGESRILSIRQQIEKLIHKMGGVYHQTHHWADEQPLAHYGFTGGPTTFHIDGHRIFENQGHKTLPSDREVVFIMSLTPDPNTSGTEFLLNDTSSPFERGGDGYTWMAKSWHLFVMRYTTKHRTSDPSWKVFLRYYVELPHKI